MFPLYVSSPSAYFLKSAMTAVTASRVLYNDQPQEQQQQRGLFQYTRQLPDRTIFISLSMACDPFLYSYR